MQQGCEEEYAMLHGLDISPAGRVNGLKLTKLRFAGRIAERSRNGYTKARGDICVKFRYESSELEVPRP
jgi:hypothetical protein